MDSTDIATTEILIRNETTIITDIISCELSQLRLFVFLIFLILIFSVYLLERRMEKLEKLAESGSSVTEEKVYRKL